MSDLTLLIAPDGREVRVDPGSDTEFKLRDQGFKDPAPAKAPEAKKEEPKK